MTVVCLVTLSKRVYFIVIEIEFEIKLRLLARAETWRAKLFNVSLSISSSFVSYGKVVEFPTDFNSFCLASTALLSIPLALRYNSSAFLPIICLSLL